MEQEKILAWHFIRDDGRTAHGDILVEAGQTYSIDETPVLCTRGFHASERLLDALKYAVGSGLCRVALWGDIKRGDDKLVAQNRRVLWMLDITRLLHEFACDVAEELLRKHGVTDERSWNAIRVKREWMDGKATDEELAAAWAAAWEAARAAAIATESVVAWAVAWAAERAAESAVAWAAARDAARAAAREAAWEAEREAARDAAREAAWEAEREAEREAARDAAREAARAAAGAAAWAAAWADLNARLEAQVLQLAGSVGYQS